MKSGGRFCVGVFGRNMATVAVKMSVHSIYVLSKFYKYCRPTSNATCKDHAAIQCIILYSMEKVLFRYASSLTVIIHNKFSFLNLVKHLSRRMDAVPS
jgi:hypothetical protein